MDIHDKGTQAHPATQPLTREALRSFGLVFTGVFSVFAAVFLWRGRLVPAQGFGAAAGLFAVVAFLVPQALRPMHGPWMRFAEILGTINTKVLLSVFYYVAFTPIGWVMRTFGKDPMDRKGRPGSYWHKPTPRTAGRKHFEQQF